MTDTTTLAPTDAEILDAAEDFRSQYTHGGTTFDALDEIGFARAVLAKWGAPAPASGEPVMFAFKHVDGTWHDASATEHSAGMRPLYEAAPPAQGARLNPDMPTQELRLHMGELTTDEVLVARAAIRWANSQQEARVPLDRIARDLFAAQPVPVELHQPKCPALIGDACACERHEPAVDKAWARFCGGIGDGPNAPYPGMIGAFERYYGQSFADKDWRSEASVWAAAWKARDNQPAATTQPAAPQGDVAAWLVLADGEPHHVTPGASDDAARLWAEDQTKCGAPYSFTFLPLCPPAAIDAAMADKGAPA